MCVLGPSRTPLPNPLPNPPPERPSPSLLIYNITLVYQRRGRGVLSPCGFFLKKRTLSGTGAFGRGAFGRGGVREGGGLEERSFFARLFGGAEQRTRSNPPSLSSALASPDTHTYVCVLGLLFWLFFLFFFFFKKRGSETMTKIRVQKKEERASQPAVRHERHNRSKAWR